MQNNRGGCEWTPRLQQSDDYLLRLERNPGRAEDARGGRGSQKTSGYECLHWYQLKCKQGDHSGRLKPPVDLVPALPAAGLPLLLLPTAQAGWQNIPHLSKREIFTILNGHPVMVPMESKIPLQISLAPTFGRAW